MRDLSFMFVQDKKKTTTFSYDWFHSLKKNNTFYNKKLVALLCSNIGKLQILNIYIWSALVGIEINSNQCKHLLTSVKYLYIIFYG